ncbi:hypothetical protein [Nonomuraea basaltis]|uniref:hypothetical protein n=1 Tax=Nonomuraea basaltis TaxID=2495887 RepID=UPI00110C594C|nr:hypothetical protein [Nonomuraea basaltis]TMR88629.1 hypothetical protein EJK15_65165 [Nonomuraea basaltis]
MTTSPVSRPGLIALAAAGLLDAAQLTSLLTVDEAPAFVTVATAVVGILTLAGVAAAWRASRAGLLTAVVARICDSLILGLPAFFLPAPWFARAIVVGCMVLGGTGIWLVAPALRRAKPTMA